jgi:hypothetical protein
MQITSAFLISCSNCSLFSGLEDESMILVVTFSLVHSGGIVTSGTTCCICVNVIYLIHKRFFDQCCYQSTFSHSIWLSNDYHLPPKVSGFHACGSEKIRGDWRLGHGEAIAEKWFKRDDYLSWCCSLHHESSGFFLNAGTKIKKSMKYVMHRIQNR